ncbi:hypothetical protein J3Q64DRAFT_1756191 [Phycomyces blakesleeanus]|uniref:Protein Abitram n=2 Tax=Phycomyces blakesleeanus TaxID=4837 RepID=A0A167JJS4_PHYB8|nr:hypothetical protein PHYBLDRAFT_160668 [Phycomyces blakesleeanus NRRL 1555(-)]OAD66129.1 hypothetical protein PHYBLDRAFT_160668 [Phycomyces blakesleeanus NRRL 1555(-)]|eukprot:XP_018284169.1 hypothetical protein PHYBLDRAFT_160668 [Phycomyces blakesleeanus NRRL 1555(-)]
MATTQSADYDISKYTDRVSLWSNDPNAHLSGYFTLYYHVESELTPTKPDTILGDIYVRQAPNKICVLGLSPSHPFIVSSSSLNKDDLKKECNVVLATELVGTKVTYDTTIAQIIVGQITYLIKARMQGQLLELNPRLKDTPELLWEHTMDTGYIAVIMSRVDDTKQQLKGYLTEEEYNTSLAEKKSE